MDTKITLHRTLFEISFLGIGALTVIACNAGDGASPDTLETPQRTASAFGELAGTVTTPTPVDGIPDDFHVLPVNGPVSVSGLPDGSVVTPTGTATRSATPDASVPPGGYCANEYTECVDWLFFATSLPEACCGGLPQYAILVPDTSACRELNNRLTTGGYNPDGSRYAGCARERDACLLSNADYCSNLMTFISTTNDSDLYKVASAQYALACTRPGMTILQFCQAFNF
jgi:hypothetical protein